MSLILVSDKSTGYFSMPSSAFRSPCLLGNNIHFIHRDRNRLDHKPINSVLQLVGVQHVNFTRRPSVIHVWQHRRPLSELWWRTGVSLCSVVWCPFPAWGVRKTKRHVACWEASIVRTWCIFIMLQLLKVYTKLYLYETKLCKYHSIFCMTGSPSSARFFLAIKMINS